MKKILFSIFALLLVFSGLPINSAQASTSDPENVNAIEQEVTNLVENYESVEIIDAEDVPEDAISLNFDSIEQYEAFLKEIEQHQSSLDTEKSIEAEILPDNDSFSIMSKTYSDVYTKTWYPNRLIKIWRPTDMHATIEYTYNHHSNSRGPLAKQFVRIKKVTSYSGSVLFGWTQTGYAANISRDKKSVTIKLNGHHTVGVTIKGFSIGQKVNDSYSITYKLPGEPAKKYR